MIDPYNDNTLGVGTLHYETAEPKAKPAPEAYTVTLLSQGRVHDSYRVDSESVTGNPATVHHHRTSGNNGCMSCGTANTCQHASALAQFLADTTRRVA